MKIEGNLRKLTAELQSPVQYRLPIGDEEVPINELIGREVSFEYSGEINCVHCGRKTSKSFSQGYCFPCMRSLAECDSCLIKPELCHYHEGTCRDPAWGEQHCFQDHYVYLANTSGLKVGITRQTHLPTRWLDQGATQVLAVFRVQNRLIAGKLEVLLKTGVADKTDWRRMLKGDPRPLDLVAERDTLYANFRDGLETLMEEQGEEAIHYLSDDAVTEIDYPVQTYPEKVVSFNLDKTPRIGGRLQGIKGQYLIFEGGVINVRKFAGYKVRLDV
jgi:hypothetical protein